MLTGITGKDMYMRARTPRGASTGTDFMLPATRDAGAAAPAAIAASGSAALLPLLALQAEDDAAARDRRAQDRTRAMLDALTALQSALLAGHADPALLAHLTALASAPTAAGDPRLAEIAERVALQAHVMLARLARV